MRQRGRYKFVCITEITLILTIRTNTISKMKTVIVATDFSKIAINATDYAVKAAQQRGYALVLFHLCNQSIHALNSMASAQTFEHLLSKEKNKLAAAAEEINMKSKVDTLYHLATGNFLEELQRCIEWYNADMVIMGMAGKSFDQDLLGNSTTGAINQLKFPVLAIPEDAVFGGISRVLFAVDMLRGVQKSVLETVTNLVQDFGATVEVFHVNNKIQELGAVEIINLNVQLFDTEMDGIQYSYKNVASNKIVEAIKNEIVATQSDLLIMVPQRYGFWESIVHKSKTRMMASGLQIPLLSLPL